jgi:Putative zinc-finger/Predicted integral membrane protein (DUF2275)
MNCEQIERRLSEYLDRSLDPATISKIESHLSCCDRCRAEADLLCECTRKIAALSQVEPPIAFAQRVIAHVKELESKPRLWESLFLPFRANLPIQATAVVLIAIIAFYIAEQEPHRKLLVPRPTFTIDDREERSPKMQPTNERSGSLQEKIPPAEETAKTGQKPIVESDQKLGSPAHGVDRGDDSQNERALQPQEPGLGAAPAPELRLDSRAPRVADPPGSLERQASASSQAITQSRRKRVTPAIPVVSDSKGLSPAYNSPAPRDLLELMGTGSLGPAPFRSEFQRLSVPADIELVVRRRPHQVGQTRDSTEVLPKADGPDVTREQGGRSIENLLLSLRESAARQTIWLALPHSQYERLKSELAAVGTIESESRKLSLSSDIAPAASPDSQLRLMLIVLPADEDGAARPAGSPSR